MWMKYSLGNDQSYDQWAFSCIQDLQHFFSEICETLAEKIYQASLNSHV